MRPHRWQPTRLPRPWDSPGKNTEVGCHFLLWCMKMKSESEVLQLCPTLSDPMDCSLPGSSIHGIFQARVLEWGAIAFSVLTGYLKWICFNRDQNSIFNNEWKICWSLYWKKEKESEVTQPCLTLCNPMDCSLPGSSIYEIFPGKSSGVGCHFLLQGIFPTQGSNLGLLHYRQTLYCLSHLYWKIKLKIMKYIY